jgi:hypothetical protein
MILGMNQTSVILVLGVSLLAGLLAAVGPSTRAVPDPRLLKMSGEVEQLGRELVELRREHDDLVKALDEFGYVKARTGATTRPGRERWKKESIFSG